MEEEEVEEEEEAEWIDYITDNLVMRAHLAIILINCEVNIVAEFF